MCMMRLSVLVNSSGGRAVAEQIQARKRTMPARHQLGGLACVGLLNDDVALMAKNDEEEEEEEEQ